MKKHLLSLSLVLFSLGAVHAQKNSSFTGKVKYFMSDSREGSWSTVYFQWNPSSMMSSRSGVDVRTFHALALGYNHSFRLMKTHPLYLELGGALQWSFASTQWEYDEDFSMKYEAPTEKWNMFSLRVPISVTYNFQVSQKIVIAPYAGLTMRLNLFGSEKTVFDSDLINKQRERYERTYADRYATFEEYLKEKEDISVESHYIFSSKDMGGSAYTANRFQIGWQVGVNVKFNNKWYLGAAYGTDFSKYSKYLRFSQGSFTLGYIF